jgi:ChaB
MVLNRKERDRLPATLKRSPTKAQETYIHTLESAEKTHRDGEAAHRIALASLKHSFEKIGDHWEPKTEKGPSDAQDQKTGPAARHSREKTPVVSMPSPARHLMDVARRLDVPGRSKMSKAQLVEAIDQANRSASNWSLRDEQR